jgi:hypothetical protein
MMIDRRRKSRWASSDLKRTFERCPLCYRRSDHHDLGCLNSQSETVRRGLIEKHGIDPLLFDVFLRVLAKKYEGR